MLLPVTIQIDLKGISLQQIWKIFLLKYYYYNRQLIFNEDILKKENLVDQFN